MVPPPRKSLAYATSQGEPGPAGSSVSAGHAFQTTRVQNSSKFTTATPTQITNQLLDTARTDTLVNYNPTTYGRGEASLSRALAPVSIR
ncbi:hypothetical protein MesoLj131c_67580 (plasmid) [Mesorhizobium sp. 131-3-5]|nr:hypothetical protein MesoLj131c_67580 [Mesorhizobium sp. 131-3-5]